MNPFLANSSPSYSLMHLQGNKSNITGNLTVNENASVPISLCTSPLEKYEALRFLVLAYYIVVMVLAILGNTLIIYIVYFNRTMRTSTNIFIANMAVCDLGIPYVLIPKRMVELLNGKFVWLIPGDIGLVLCKLVPFVHDVFVDCSTYSLLLITFDRFCAVLLPHKRHLLSNKVLIILICSAWIASISVDAVFFKVFTPVYKEDGKLYCVPDWWSKSAADAFIRALICTNIIAPIILITSGYSAIFYKLKRQVQILGNSISDQLRRQECLRQKKIAKMTFAIVCTFGLCWLPVIFTSLLRPSYSLFAKTTWYPCWIYEFAKVSEIIQILSSVTNPAVCFIFGLKFREEFLRKFQAFRICCCRGNRKVGNNVRGNDEGDAGEGEVEVRGSVIPS